jgi:asparagine synthase (glutamine-hydrolysing)
MNSDNYFLLEFDRKSKTLLHFDYSTTDKFKDDKVFIDTDELLFILDGAVFNKKALLAEKNSDDWSGYLVDAYKANRTFFKELKGTFWGVVLEKSTGTILAFSDHIGSKQMFYVDEGDTFILSTNSYNLTRHLKDHPTIHPKINELGAFMVLSYGYVIEDVTVVEEIKRLMPGFYLSFVDGKLGIKQFYRIRKNVQEVSDEEAFEELDARFKSATKAAFDKDREYGYQHLVALSGGLDSRMTTYVAHELGYTDQTNITFSQSNYLDEQIAKQIASDLKHEWIFKSLDNGIFLKRVDLTTELTGGNVTYFGVGHGFSLLDNLDMRNYGMLHSGQSGNSIIGTFPDHALFDKPFTLEGLAPDATTKRIVGEYQLKNEYEDYEMYKHRNHCFIGGNNGFLAAQKKTETISPFYDLDVLEFCMSISSERRANHNFYRKWINTKYPKAAQYVWDATQVPVNAKMNIKIKGNSYNYRQLSRYALGKTIYRYSPNKKRSIDSSYHMNPIEYWFKTNPELVNFYNSYVDETLDCLSPYPELKQYVHDLSKSSSRLDSVKVLSILSIAKVLHG